MAREHATSNPFFARLLEQHYSELVSLARGVARKFPSLSGSDLAQEATVSLLRSSTPPNNLSNSLERERFFKRVLRNKAITLVREKETLTPHAPIHSDERVPKKAAEPTAPQNMNHMEFRESLERLSSENRRIVLLYLKHHTAVGVGKELFPHLSHKSQKALGFKAVKKAAGAFFGLPSDVAHHTPMRPEKSRNPRNTRHHKFRRKA